MLLNIKPITIAALMLAANIAAAFEVEKVGELQTWGIDDGRLAEGSAKHAVWIGDWNDDGIPEYFVTTKTGGTSTLFYSTTNGTWIPTDHWYAPSYSVVVLDTKGDARPEYIIKTSKFKTTDTITSDMFADYFADAPRSWTTVFKIPDDPINNPLEIVQVFDRSVPILQGCADVDGDGYKDLLVTHHTTSSEYIARYYKGKDDSDGVPFESIHQWASTGKDSSLFADLGEHKARWGDLQIINNGGTVKKRLFAVGSENDDNNVIYWDYDPIKDKFQRNPTVLDVSSIARSVNNQLNLVSIRALPGAIMLAGRDGAYFLKYSAEEDTYTLKDVPGIEESMSNPNNEYSDFWCFNSGKNDGTMVFAILRKPNGNRNSAIEFRTFDPSLPNNEQISELLTEVALPPKAQRIVALRVDDSYDVMLDVKQIIVAHKQGATILDVVY